VDARLSPCVLESVDVMAQDFPAPLFATVAAAVMLDSNDYHHVLLQEKRS